MNFKEEILRRRTFGIISHPDAGKTSLTEKFLLFGGAIQEAGAVKNNKIKKSAISDFMEIEKQRGISVSTSVLSFEYKNKKINILDTPGHKDFIEDTFRTLTAIDSVILVIDAAKGIETQTEKLVEVCKMQKIPIIIFINKLDRESQDIFDLLNEIEEKLRLRIVPLSWPIGVGKNFQGIYNIWEKNILFFSGEKKQKIESPIEFKNLHDSRLNSYLGNDAIKKLQEDLKIIKEIYPFFKKQLYLNAKLQPIFFGSALNNFGVRELLNVFIEIAPSPIAKISDKRLVQSDEKTFTGFIFKIHANIDPKHRNRIAFLKITSGIFKRNTFYLHVRLGKKFKYTNPNSFIAYKKNIIEKSFPGDIIGLYDTGNFKIGDTLTEGEIINFKSIPSFPPEHFRYINNADPMKYKQLEKGIQQLTDEGIAHLFTIKQTGKKIIGTVGILQYDVIQYRLKYEYGAQCTYDPLNIYKICWIEIDDENNPEFQEFKTNKQYFLAEDKKGGLVFLAESSFSIKMIQEKYPKIRLRFTSEKI